MNEGEEIHGEALKRVPNLSPGDVPGGNPVAALDCGYREANLLGNNLTAEEISAISANNEHHRTENFRNHFELIAVCGLWAFAIIMFLVGLTWFYHLITPSDWHWLSDGSVTRIQNIMTGSVLAAVAGGHLKRRLG